MSTLQSIHTFEELKDWLGSELDWPVEDFDYEDLVFEYNPEEVGLGAEYADAIRSVHQLRPLHGQQPWGIFFVEFASKRLPVTLMRRILRNLVVKKRASANRSDRVSWEARDLLFITAIGEASERSITFAHFVEAEGSNLAELRVLGWDDDDTKLHMRLVENNLKEYLRWDDDLAEDPWAWREHWAKAFRIRHRHAINKSAELAQALAEVAKRLRKRLEDILGVETDKGEIRRLYKSFRECLIHDLDESGFADMFAQTVTYGLFSLACRRTVEGEGTAFARDDLNHYFTSPFLRDMLGIFLGLKIRSGNLDFDEMGVAEVQDLLTSEDTHMDAILADFNNRTRGEDPVIHFYEHFLEKYEKVERKRRGVYYTPQPVVSYIVRSVHELLQTEFGLNHGLADTTTWGEMLQRDPDLKLPPLTEEEGETRTISPDEPFVQILDPAAGTATFLVFVIEVVHDHLLAEWKKGGLGSMPDIPRKHRQGSPPKSFADYWQIYVSAALLPRLHGYELMMAPYAIAHMKIGLKLAETGYCFGIEERARIYLTNALEPWQRQLSLPDFEALAQESAAVNEIKRNKRFTVVIGNPPYAGISSNMSENAQRLVDRYRYVNGEPLGERKLWLQNDYVKFLGFAHRLILKTKVGCLGYITDNSYLDGPTFRGVRSNFLQDFSKLEVLNLHGSAKRMTAASGAETDQNVFDITQAVVVMHGVRLPGQGQHRFRTASLRGTRQTKYDRLSKQTVACIGWSDLTPTGPFFQFVETNTDGEAEFNAYYSIKAAFPLQSVGIQTSRDDLAIGFTRQELARKVCEFASPKVSDAEIRERYFPGRKVGDYLAGDTRGWSLSAARKGLQKIRNLDSEIVCIHYRPFDFRFVFNSKLLVDWPRPEVSEQMASGKNLGLCLLRRTENSGDYNYFSVSRNAISNHQVSLKDGTYLLPLYLESAGSRRWLFSSDHDKSPNLSPNFLKAVAAALQLPQKGEHGLPAGLTPEDIFHYIYAVFHSPGYRIRYAEFLKIDFPRLPLTGSLDLFRELSRLGGDLTALHLLESPKLDDPITEFVGSNRQVRKVLYTPDNGGTVWIDGKGSAKKPQPGTSGFVPVSEEVWNFQIGGYQVCEKWLKDRGPKKGNPGRTLTDEDIAHYHKIVIALTGTIRLMGEIDEVIEKHGGWPGAFSTGAENQVADAPNLAPAARRDDQTPKRKPQSSTGELFDLLEGTELGTAREDLPRATKGPSGE